MAVLVVASSTSQPIKLESKTINPSESVEHPGLQGFSSNTASGDYKLLQFKEPVGKKHREDLTDEVRFISYIPENAWLVELEGSRSGVVSDSKVRYLGPYRPEYKVSPAVETGSGKVNVNVQFFGSASSPLESLGDLASAEKEVGSNTWLVETSGENISKIASLQHVRWISPKTPPPTTFNDDSRALINADTVQSSPYNLNGSGFTAAVWDAGWAGLHEDLNYTLEWTGNEKTIRGDSGHEVLDHATHVSGTMVGAGNKNSDKRGVAPSARLVTYEWPPNKSTELVSETKDAFLNYNSVVSQNSWGWNLNAPEISPDKRGNYDYLGMFYDNLSRGYEGVNATIVFSAGNYGDSFSPRYNTTVGPGATAKNVIAVGAVDGSSDMTFFSSWGPTDDGRVKPDLVANGFSVSSSIPDRSIDSDNDGNDDYTYPYDVMSGTSMAAPAVSGAVVLVNQKYNRTFGEKPDPATVKGLLIQNAEDLNRTGPDYITGWGLFDIKESVDYIDSADRKDLIKTGKVNNSGSDTYTFNLSDRSANITLVWSDYPASAGAGEALVNNLDLNVTNSTGHRFYPWTLNWSSRTETASRTRNDSTNNVEQVYIPNGSGKFTVEVNGTNVPQPNQSYSLLLDTTVGDHEPPKLTIGSPDNKTFSKTPDFNLTSNENLTGANFTIDGGSKRGMDNSSSKKFFNLTTSLADGTHEINFTAKDIVGNWNTTDLTFTVDTEAPNLAAIKPIDGANLSSNFTVNATWIDATSSVEANYSLENNSGSLANGGLNGSIDISDLEDGAYNLSFNATDAAGNFNNTTISLDIDTGKPSAKIIRPLENGNVSGNFTVNATWNDSTTAVNVSDYYLINSTGVQDSGSLNATVNSTLLKDGNYEFNYTFEDYAGNVLNMTRDFRVDNSPPSFAINEPVDSANLSSNLSVDATFNDATGIDNTTYRFFNSSGNVTLRRNTSLEFDTTGLEEGTYNISFWMTDTLNNSQVHNVTDLTVDNTDPSINTTSYNSSGWVRGQRTVGLNCSDSLTGVENATSSISGTVQDFSSGSYPVNLSLSANGNNTYVFACEDYAGNNATEERHLEIDSESPDFESADPDNDTSDVDKSFSLEVSFDSEDRESGLNETNSSVIITEGSLDDKNWTNSSFKADVSGLDHSQSFEVNLNVSDNVGHSSSIHLEYEVKEDTSSNSDSGSDDGGGGGGGSSGGGPSGSPSLFSPESTDLPEVKVQETPEGVSIPEVELSSEPQQIEVDSPGLDVESIEVSGDGDVGFEISRSTSDVEPPENTEEYSSFDLSRNGTGELDMNVTFRVNKSWFADRSTDPNSTHLYRKNDSRWQQLETSIKSEESRSYKYTARVPGFSRFTIAASSVCEPVYGVKDGVCREYTSCELPGGVREVESCQSYRENQTSEQSETNENDVLLPDINPALVIGPLFLIMAAIIIYFEREKVRDFFHEDIDFDSWPGEE